MSVNLLPKSAVTSKPESQTIRKGRREAGIYALQGNKAQPLLFVNKDATNIMIRNKAESHAINSHVQIINKRWVRERERNVQAHEAFQSKNRPLQPRLRTHQPLTDHVVPDQQLPEYQTEQNEVAYRRITPLVRWEAERADNNMLVDDAVDREAQLLAAVLGRLRPKPQSILQKGNSDPFAASAVPLTPAVTRLIRLAKDWYSVTAHTSNTDTGISSSTMTAWSNDIKYGISSEAHFCATMYCVAAFVGILMTPTTSTKSDLDHEGLIHRGRSIAAIGGLIRANGPNSHTLRAIIRLSAAEYYAGNLEVAWLHRLAINRIVDSLGGFDCLDDVLKGPLVISDLTICSRLLRRSHFSLTSWDPGPFSSQHFKTFPPAKRDRMLLHATSEPLSPRLNFDNTDDILQLILHDVQQLVAIKYLAEHLSDDSQRAEILRWWYRRLFVVKSRLFNHYLDLIGPQDPLPHTPRPMTIYVSAATCLAAMCCHGFHAYCNPAIIAMHSPLDHLQKSLDDLIGRMTEQAYSSHSHLLLWMLFVGALSEECTLNDHTALEFRWFSARFHALARRLQLSTWQAIKASLRHFLHREQSDDEHMRSLFSRAGELSCSLAGSYSF